MVCTKGMHISHGMYTGNAHQPQYVHRECTLAMVCTHGMHISHGMYTGNAHQTWYVHRECTLAIVCTQGMHISHGMYTGNAHLKTKPWYVQRECTLAMVCTQGMHISMVCTQGMHISHGYCNIKPIFYDKLQLYKVLEEHLHLLQFHGSTQIDVLCFDQTITTSTNLFQGSTQSPQHFSIPSKFFSASFMSLLISSMPSSILSNCSVTHQSHKLHQCKMSQKGPCTRDTPIAHKL